MHSCISASHWLRSSYLFSPLLLSLLIRFLGDGVLIKRMIGRAWYKRAGDRIGVLLNVSSRPKSIGFVRVMS